MATASQIVAAARYAVEHRSYKRPGLCLQFTRECGDIPAKYDYAIDAWYGAKHRHTGTPPPGAPTFWAGGKAGHIAPSVGGGRVASTDILHAGYTDYASIPYISQRWGKTYLGWTSELNGVPISGLEGLVAGVQVRLANLRPGSRNADVKDLQLALRRHGMARYNPSGATGFFGDETRKMVVAFQRSQGWTGNDANGIPGPKTAGLLGLHVI
jgi:hypothetical protein